MLPSVRNVIGPAVLPTDHCRVKGIFTVTFCVFAMDGLQYFSRYQGIKGLPFLLLALVLASCTKPEGITTTERDLVVGVYASGTVVPDGQYKLYSLAEGYLRRQLVLENDTFRTGQLLFELESTEQTSKRALAQEARTLTQLNSGPNNPQLVELRLQLQTLTQKLAQDSLNLSRYQTLLREGATTPTELERRTLAYTSSLNEVKAARQRMLKLERQQQLDLSNAESALVVSAVQEGYYTLKAPTQGRIYEVYKNEHELVRRGEPIALVGHPTAHHLVLSVDEQDIAKLKPGQEVYAEADAFKGKVYKARISKIYPALNQQDQSYKLEATFTDAFPVQYVGMGVEANIIISKKEKAVCIPAEYVLPGDTVWAIGTPGEDAKPLKLTRGESNFDWVEVLAGLPKGAQVVMPPKKK